MKRIQIALCGVLFLSTMAHGQWVPTYAFVSSNGASYVSQRNQWSNEAAAQKQLCAEYIVGSSQFASHFQQYIYAKGKEFDFQQCAVAAAWVIADGQQNPDDETADLEARYNYEKSQRDYYKALWDNGQQYGSYTTVGVYDKNGVYETFPIAKWYRHQAAMDAMAYMGG